MLLATFSCTSANQNKDNFIKRISKGVVQDSIVCKNAPEISYCLYIPKSYQVDKKYPLLLAFDPHGDGRLPVNLMKTKAEKEGIILIGSNNSKNGLGMEEVFSIVKTLLSEAKENLAVDTTRIYLAGFSGGARVACASAQLLPEIKGVIACSGGFQPGNAAPAFHFVGAAGNNDMNYLEMKKLYQSLSQMQASCQFLVFNGKHAWPPEEVMNEAIGLLTLYAMKDKSIPVNTSWIENFKKEHIEYANDLIKNNIPDSMAKAYSVLKETVEMLDGISDITMQKEKLSGLQRDLVLQNYLKLQNETELREANKQQELIAAFEKQSALWWQKEISSLNEQSLKVSAGIQQDAARRLLAFISLCCYSYTNMALQNQSMDALTFFTNIYIQSDPENTEANYLMACILANKGEKDNAIKALQKAIDYGFKDKKRISNDPMLQNLQGMPGFDKIVK